MIPMADWIVRDRVKAWELVELKNRAEGNFDGAVFAQERAHQWRTFGYPCFGFSRGAQGL